MKTRSHRTVLNVARSFASTKKSQTKNKFTKSYKCVFNSKLSLRDIGKIHRCKSSCNRVCKGITQNKPSEIVIYEQNGGNWRSKSNSGVRTLIFKGTQKLKNSRVKVISNESNYVESEQVLNIPTRILNLLSQHPVSLGSQLQNTLSDSPKSCSPNIHRLDGDPFTFCRDPVAQSTDAIRSENCYTGGVHAWRLTWPVSQRGTHAVVGVCTESAPLQCMGYQCLVGSNGHSWGWDIGRLKIYHDFKNNEGVRYPAKKNFLVSESFLMILDMDVGTLSFVVEDEYLGVAVSGLRGKRLYPVCSSVWGMCQFSFKYIASLPSGSSLSLTDRCRNIINASVCDKNLDELILPKKIVDFLKYKC